LRTHLVLDVGVLRRVRLLPLSTPWAFAPLIIRWGEHASSDVLRQRARCSRCGHLGATLRHPSWSGDVHAGDSPFPVERLGKIAKTPTAAARAGVRV
jgi:hypothetical protein